MEGRQSPSSLPLPRRAPQPIRCCLPRVVGRKGRLGPRGPGCGCRPSSWPRSSLAEKHDAGLQGIGGSACLPGADPRVSPWLSQGPFIPSVVSSGHLLCVQEHSAHQVSAKSDSLLKSKKAKVAQSCLTLWTPMDWTVHGILQARTLEWAGNLPNPGIKPRSPTLQADSLPAEPPGKPNNTGVGSLSFSRGSSRSRDRTRVSGITS